MSEAPYDRLGRGYSRVRRPDPRIAEQIDAALGTARTVLNVGAGTGFPEMLSLKRRSGVTSRELAELLPGAAVEPIPVPRDCTDQFFAALWARPEKLFDEEVLKPDVGLAEHLGDGASGRSRAPAVRSRERGLGAALRAPAHASRT